jgi:hypothetical protein
MGMYDDLTMLETDSRISCAAGHPVRSLQTKGLASDMDHYYILDGRLYVVRRRGDDDEVVVKYDRRVNDMFLIHESRLERVDLSRTVEFHGYCSECVPVFTRSEHLSYLSQSHLEPHQPWVELEIKFKAGQVAVIDKTSACESRQQLREKLARGGSALLADDEPEVMKRLAE